MARSARSRNTDLVASGNIGTTVSLTGSRGRGHLYASARPRPTSIRGRPDRDPRRRSGAPRVLHRDAPLADHGRNANVPRIAITRLVCLEPIVSRSGPTLTRSPFIRQIISKREVNAVAGATSG